jgi:hypothetical protein
MDAVKREFSKARNVWELAAPRGDKRPDDSTLVETGGEWLTFGPIAGQSEQMASRLDPLGWSARSMESRRLPYPINTVRDGSRCASAESAAR